MSTGLAIWGAIGGWAQGSILEAHTKANNRLQEAEAGNSNRVRSAENAFAAARGALQRYVQSVNNNRRLEVGGKMLEAATVNAYRQEDAALASDFERQIRGKEQLGYQAAAAALAGVGGEVADNVSIATRLTQQRAEREAITQASFRSFDAGRRAAAVAQQMVSGLDSSVILDSLNYSINVAKKNKSFSPWIAALAGLGGDSGPLDFSRNSGSSTRVGGGGGGVDWGSAPDQSSAETARLNRSGTWGASSSYWGTGAGYGNEDYGNFI